MLRHEGGQSFRRPRPFRPVRLISGRAILAVAALAALWLLVPTAVSLAASDPSATVPTVTTTVPVKAVPAGTTKYQQNDPHFGYAGNWSTLTAASADGGSLAYANSTASVTMTFDGKYLAWLAKIGPTYGKAKLTLDGTRVYTVDLHSATTVYKSVVWETPSSLAAGPHSVKIEWTGTGGSNGYSLINVDAVKILGTITQAPIVRRYEQTNTLLAYAGTWTSVASADYSGGSLTSVRSLGASVTVSFTGTYLAWIGKKGSSFGKARVTLDGTTCTVDLYSPTNASRQTLWHSPTGLASGSHTLKIEWTGDKSVPTGGTGINVDAFDVVGSLTKAYVVNKYQETNSLLEYSGVWDVVPAAGASEGSFMQTKSGSGAVEFKFSGRKLVWIATKGPGMGEALVSVDGKAAVMVDLSGAADAHQQRVWGTGILSAGEHTVKISRDPATAPGTYINVDAIEVTGSLVKAAPPTRYEQDDPRFLFSGSWSTAYSSIAYSGSYKRGSTGTGVTVSFTGTRLDWVAIVGLAMGMADVSLDGKPAVKVDLHSTGPAYRKMVWSTGTLPSGKHTVDITWDEGNAAGTFISVDAFNILGTVPWPKSLTRDQVKWMEQRLSDLSYLPGTIDGVVDKKTTGAVIAFQKWEGMTRNGTISVDVLTRLQTASRPKASRALDTNPSLEVIKGKQVMLFCKDGAVVWTLHVCTGSASVGIITPSATFHITRKTRELSPLYLPMYLRNTKLAIHGYPSVPVYPASHGCVRTQFWDEDVIYPLIAVGTAVYIHD